MKSYHWTVTPPIANLLIRLEAAKLVWQKSSAGLETPPGVIRNSLLKSAVYSARIEGIPSTLQQPLKEAQNLQSAYQFLQSAKLPKILTLSLIRKFHRVALAGLSAHSGELRHEPWAIFNSAGVAIYLAPAHFKLPQILPEYVSYINHLADHPAVIAAVAQFIFEKLHPFADGNGRVGRLISAYILTKSSLHFNFSISIEEYVENNRDHYYLTLEPSHNATAFLEFFLTALVAESSKLESPKVENSPTLLPHRHELLEIISDHPRCSFNFLSRRFPAINPKTLHFDLLWLQKNFFIQKLGVTRGAVYAKR